MKVLTWNRIELYYYQNDEDESDVIDRTNNKHVIDMVINEDGVWMEPTTNILN